MKTIEKLRKNYRIVLIVDNLGSEFYIIKYRVRFIFTFWLTKCESGTSMPKLYITTELAEEAITQFIRDELDEKWNYKEVKTIVCKEEELKNI